MNFDFVQKLACLAILALCNIGTGLYNNVAVKQIDFDKKKLFEGIVKALIIMGTFTGLYYAFGVLDLSSIGISPEIVLTSANILYATKACTNLAQILGVKLDK